MKRLLVLLITVGWLLGVTPGLAFAGTVPLTVTAGTAQLTFTDWCHYEGPDLPPAGQRKWVDAMDMSLAMRVDGRQRTVSLTASPGPHYMACSSSTLPGMTFSGTSTVGTSSTEEPVTGWCWGVAALVDNFECTLSFVGHEPAVLSLRWEGVYEQCDGEGSAVPGACYDTLVVAGVQNVVPSGVT